jgi:ABC-type branched-subunit amino acid transport system substrate-binding protein
MWGKGTSRQLVAAVLGLGLLGTGCGSGGADAPGAADGASEDGPIVIGVIADLTGPFAVYGTNVSRNVQLAAEEINAAGGVDGRQLEVIVEDIQTDVAATVDKSRKLVQSDGVDVVIGPIGSDANDAALQTVVTEGETILMYPQVYEGGKCDPLFFHTGATPAQQVPGLIERLQAEYGPKALLFGADYVWPRRSFEVAKPVIEAGGGEVVGEVYLPLVADDYSELISAVRESQPDYIFSLYPAVYGAAVKALDDAGLLDDDLGMGTIFLGEESLPTLGDLGTGTYTTLPFFTDAQGDGVDDFVARYRAAYGDDAVPGGGETLGAYAAVHLYAQAVAAAGTTESTAVAAALAGQSFEGPTGTVTMTDSHHLQQPIQTARVNEDGVYEFVEVFDAVEPGESCQP